MTAVIIIAVAIVAVWVVSILMDGPVEPETELLGTIDAEDGLLEDITVELDETDGDGWLYVKQGDDMIVVPAGCRQRLADLIAGIEVTSS